MFEIIIVWYVIVILKFKIIIIMIVIIIMIIIIFFIMNICNYLIKYNKLIFLIKFKVDLNFFMDKVIV